MRHNLLYRVARCGGCHVTGPDRHCRSDPGSCGRRLRPIGSRPGDGGHRSCRGAPSRLGAARRRGVDVRRWSPPVVDDDLEADCFAGATAVVNLAGAPLGGRPWTPGHKRAILQSRLDADGTPWSSDAPAARSGTSAASCVNAPASMSTAIARSGEVTEADAPGDSFLAGVVQAWERAAQEAAGPGRSRRHGANGDGRGAAKRSPGAWCSCRSGSSWAVRSVRAGSDSPGSTWMTRSASTTSPSGIGQSTGPVNPRRAGGPQPTPSSPAPSAGQCAVLRAFRPGVRPCAWPSGVRLTWSSMAGTRDRRSPSAAGYAFEHPGDRIGPAVTSCPPDEAGTCMTHPRIGPRPMIRACPSSEAGSIRPAPEARANHAAMAALVGDLRARQAALAGGGAGGDERSIARHRERGKLPVRERIDRLIDPGSAFLELSPLAANGLYDDEAPGAGIVTGIGRVEGTTCVIVANDATVKGGTYYPMTVKKHLRAQEIALENRLPVHLPGRFRRRVPAPPGRRLPRSRPLRPDLLQPGADVGRGHPAGRAGDGLLHGRRRVRPGDERRDRHRPRHRHDLPRRPAAREGRDRRGRHARGARRIARSTPGGPASPTTRRSTTSTRSRSGARSSSNLNRGRPSRPGIGGDPEPPAVDPAATMRTASLYAAVSLDPRRPMPVRELIARLVDGWRFHEFKPLYGETLVCGFAHLAGYPVAILANDGILFSQSALKGAHFIELACQRRIPLVFLQNITGFMVGREYEEAGIAKDGAKLVTAVASRRGAEVHGAHRRLVRRRELRDGRSRLPAAVPVVVAEQPDLGHGRRAGGARPLDGPRRVRRRRRARRLRGADPRDLRARGLALLRHGAPVGRRRHRPARHAPRPDAWASRPRSTPRSRRRGSASSGCRS